MLHAFFSSEVHCSASFSPFRAYISGVTVIVVQLPYPWGKAGIKRSGSRYSNTDKKTDRMAAFVKYDVSTSW